jgi:hypothetical protein
VPDFETKQHKADTTTGELLYNLPVVALDKLGAEVIQLKIAGVPKVGQGAMLKLHGLVATPWSMETVEAGRSPSIAAKRRASRWLLSGNASRTGHVLGCSGRVLGRSLSGHGDGRDTSARARAGAVRMRRDPDRATCDASAMVRRGDGRTSVTAR